MANRHNVALFVTCLVDLLRPNVAHATVKLLESTRCSVSVPRRQTCCGQPAYNSGDRPLARKIARKVIQAFDGYDYVVVPSGSCAAMIKLHYPNLFADQPEMLDRARDLAERTHEAVSFLVEILGVKQVAARYPHACAYHDGCSGLRELGIQAQPRALLNSISGLEIKELERGEQCCGFGGTFCIKYPDISNHMVEDKVKDILASGADTLLAGDLGCLVNIAGKLSRTGAKLRVLHVTEVLAGMTKAPAIGEPGG